MFWSSLKAKGKLYLCSLFALCAVLLCCASFAFVNIFGGSFGKNSQTDSDNIAGAIATGTTTFTLTSASNTITAAQKNDYAGLINAIGKAAGYSASGYYGLASRWGDTKLDSTKFTDYKVVFGGYIWNIMYVSKNNDASQDVIVTLWLADTGTDAGLDTYVSCSYGVTMATNKTVPMNMYGTSYVRSSLVGSQYIGSTDTSTLTNGIQHDAWKRFTDTSGLANYLSTPSKLDWQKNQSATEILKHTYNLSNEAWGTPSGGSFLNGFDYSGKLNYTAWQNDKIWLPSISEVGLGQNTGLWKVSREQTLSSETKTSWSRSCWEGTPVEQGNEYGIARSIQGAATGYGNNGVTDPYAVRPAIHLNLKAACRAIDTNVITTKPTLSAGDKTYNGNAQALVSNFDTTKMQIAYTYKPVKRSYCAKLTLEEIEPFRKESVFWERYDNSKAAGEVLPCEDKMENIWLGKDAGVWNFEY